MTDYRLTDPSRGTLEFRQAQRDEDAQRAAADITAEIAPSPPRPPLVHVRARERERRLTGRVTAPRREAFDGTTNDWQQALANYVVRLEAFCDEYQGDGYTFEDDLRSESMPVIMKEVKWTLLGGQPYEVEFETTMETGTGVLATRSLDVDDATVDTSMDVIATADGVDLPGLRTMEVTKGFETEVDALYGKQSASNNQIVVDDGTRHEFMIEGTHTGSIASRRQADADLESLIGAGEVDLVTRFPGYTKRGKVLNYESNFDASYGTDSHQYRFTFLRATDA